MYSKAPETALLYNQIFVLQRTCKKIACLTSETLKLFITQILLFLCLDYNIPKTKSTDWPGLCLVFVHLNHTARALILPAVEVLVKTDPFFYIFKL